ncbi:hypothetical protein JW935_02550 [candidate division KSB1 bacterium]|nr:hypothetical protein [candidate division KSB1 bacterium]
MAKECPSCAVAVDDKAETCYICGYEFPRQKMSIKIVVIVLVLVFLGMLVRILMNVLD